MTTPTPAGEPNPDGAPARILVVDDEDTLRRLTRRHLEKAGYLCADAADAAEARTHLEEQPFEVVLCDVRMPGESGLDLIRHITDRYPDTSTVMISGLDDTDTADRALELGAVGYVVKPFERNELLINVANALNRRTLMLENRRHRERLEELVELQANYDLLTGLANRTHLTRRLSLLLSAGSAESAGAVLFLDLDHFRVINDSLGHEAGDELLREVATALTGLLGKDDLAARFGGDGFVVLVADAGGRDGAGRLAEEIHRVLEQPHVIGGRDLYTSASIGIVADLEGYPTADAVLRDADAAMHQAKAAGRGTFRVVDEAIRARAQKRFDIETGLRAAIEQGQLLVHYQPQFSLRSRSLVGFEALVRWHHPELGLVMPDEFIPVAEESGLITPLGRWVLHQACADLTAFHQRAGVDTLGVAVNVSGAQLVRGTIVDDVAEVLAASDLCPERLCLEITESVLLEGLTAASRTLGALKELGVRISVDDFGTGYSSLSYIGKLPIDELKIDRAFVIDLADTSGAALVRGIIGLAQALGHEVVAEGVETHEQLEQLEADACDMAQGYLLGRPVPADQILELLGAGTTLDHLVG
jgi:diguanylate cyclase (GGDEF)-like protein